MGHGYTARPDKNNRNQVNSRAWDSLSQMFADIHHDSIGSGIPRQPDSHTSISACLNIMVITVTIWGERCPANAIAPPHGNSPLVHGKALGFYGSELCDSIM